MILIIVSATSAIGDPYYIATGNKESLIIYATADSRGKVSYGLSGLAPSGVYDSNVWTSPRAKGTSNTADSYISVAFDVGTLAPGESTTFYILQFLIIDEVLNELACLADNVEVVEKLIQSGSSLQLKNNNDQSPIEIALCNVSVGSIYHILSHDEKAISNDQLMNVRHQSGSYLVHHTLC